MIKKPCRECPFRKTSSYLHPGRARELAENATSDDGSAFWCHKTLRERPKMQCGGMAIFGQKLGHRNQAMRIAVGLGLYRPDELLPHYDLVYDSVQAMEAGHDG